MYSKHNHTEKINQTKLIDIFGIVFLSAFLIVPLLSVIPVYQVSEGREGVVVNSILESKEWTLPLRHQEIIPSKPPFFHWIAALICQLTGENSAFELRLPSALAAVGMLLCVYILGTSYVSRLVGLTASGILLSTYGFLRLAADGRVDMLFCFLVVAAVTRWLVAAKDVLADGGDFFGISSGVHRTVAIFTGLAVLTKGPLGLLLVTLLVTMFTLVANKNGLKSLVRKEWIWAFAIPAPWYLAANFSGQKGFLGRQIIFENIDRFFGSGGISRKPFWFYLEQFWGHAAPWSLAVLFILFALLRKERLFEADSKHRNFVKLLIVWILTLLIFFSLSVGKRSAYLLPILPAYSLLLAMLANKLIAQTPDSLKKAHTLFDFSCIFIFVFCIILFVFLSPFGLGVLAKLFDSKLNNLSLILAGLGIWQAEFGIRLLCYFVILALSTVCLRRVSQRDNNCLPPAIFSLLLLVFVLPVQVFLGYQGVTHTYKDFADVVNKIGGNEPLTFIKRKRDESFDGLFFYLGRNVKIYDPADSPGEKDDSLVMGFRDLPLDFTLGPPQEGGLYLIRRRWLVGKDPNWLARIEELAEGGRAIDSAEQRLVLFRLKEAVIRSEY